MWGMKEVLLKLFLNYLFLSPYYAGREHLGKYMVEILPINKDGNIC